MWIGGVISLAIAVLAAVVLHRLRARPVAVERHTQFGMSAIDPAIASQLRAAWEPPSDGPRAARTAPTSDVPRAARRTAPMAYGPAAPMPGAERLPMPYASCVERSPMPCAPDAERSAVRLARSSRTSIGYAVVPPVALRTSGLRNPEAAYERTTFDPALPDLVERHDRATRALRVTKK